VDAKLGNEDLMILCAEEDDANAPIDWAKITQIEALNSSCHTAKGRHPGPLVQDVEKGSERLRKS
jgi:hypothetical protein